MAGMDAGLWSYPTDIGLFVTTWVVMMAAMMLPSMPPTVLAYERAAREQQARPAAFAMAGVFVLGYLAVWSAAGLLAFAVLRVGTALDSGLFTGSSTTRYLAAGVLLVAVAYELVPPKRACLSRSCAPVPARWQAGDRGGIGALRLGLVTGGWCVGCCWALMAALFALGVMSLTWMIVISLLISVEKLLPSHRWPAFGIAVVLAGLAIALLLGAPIFTVPGHTGMSM
jgi:predicted metal-binding membrane protein